MHVYVCLCVYECEYFFRSLGYVQFYFNFIFCTHTLCTQRKKRTYVRRRSVHISNLSNRTAFGPIEYPEIFSNRMSEIFSNLIVLRGRKSKSKHTSPNRDRKMQFQSKHFYNFLPPKFPKTRNWVIRNKLFHMNSPIKKIYFIGRRNRYVLRAAVWL